MRTTALKTCLAAAAALALAGCGKPLLYAEVEIPDVRVSLSELSFASTSNPDPLDLCPPEVVLTGTQTCIQKGVEIDLGKDFTDLTKDAVDYELRLTQLGITLTSTTLQDFGQVAEVHVAVQATGDGQPAVDLATYLRPAPGVTPTTIVVRAMSSVDLGAYVKSGKVSIYSRMIFDTDMPAFNADVVGDFYLRATVDYGKKAGIY